MGAMEVMGVLVKALGAALIPKVTGIAQLFSERLQAPNASSKQRVAGLAVFADFITYGGKPAVAAYASSLFQVSLTMVTQDPPSPLADDNPDDEERVQVAAYALGSLAVHATQTILPQATLVVSKLELILQHPHAKHETRKT